MIGAVELLDLALEDDRITSKTELRVLWLVARQLDALDFQRVKHDPIAHKLSKSRVTILEAMQKLAEFGYFESGEKSGKGVGTYRLPQKRPVLSAQLSVAPTPKSRVLNPGIRL